MTTALNLVTAPDAYSAQSTVSGHLFPRIIIDVNNQGIYRQLQVTYSGSSVGVWEDTEVFQGPGSKELRRSNVTGIRFRAAVKAANLPAGSTQAVVTIEAVEEP